MQPSGTIVFSSGRGIDFDLWSLDLSNGELSQLTFGENLNDQACFSPDGKLIAYISTGADCIPSLWLMDANGENKKRLTSKFFCQTPTFSPDGKSVVFSANANDGNNIDIFKLDINAESASPELLVSSAAREWSPSLSPCGNKLVFCIQGEGNDTQISEMDLSSKQIRSLASHAARDICPKYSPDGKFIAFISYREGFDTDLHENIKEQIAAAVKASDMNEVNSLILQLNGVEGDSEIFVMDSSGANLRQLTHNQRSDANICWSPCSKYICFTSGSLSENETERLRVIEVASGKEQALNIDRAPLEAEIGASQKLNSTIFQKVVPDWIEKRLVSRSFWGEDRNPAWKA